MRKFNLYKIPIDFSIRAAIKKMDQGGIGFIACVDEKEAVVSVVTDGDFRRAILRGVNLENKVSNIANRNFYSLQCNFKNGAAKNIFENTVARHIPILKDGKLVDILLEEDFYKAGKKRKLKKARINLPVVIMAGGEGVRLDPFTRILPKPLIPIGEKPIIEIIMDRFAQYGMTNFYISVNHGKKMIKAFFENHNSNYKITFIEESKPLGTAGALKFLEDKFKTPFFVSNCDITIETDYTDIYKFHTEGEYDLTLVASMQHRKIPYGVCEIENGGDLKILKEKPEYDFLVNAGFYILNSAALEFIPKQQYFDMTDLINRLKKRKKKIGVFPISEKSWIDVGQWEEYKKSVKRMNVF